MTRSKLMSTTTHYKEGVAILEPTGKIIGGAVPELRDTMFKQINTTYTPRILIIVKPKNMCTLPGRCGFLTASMRLIKHRFG